MKKKAQRATSNVFSMFDQKQVQEFKEVLINIYSSFHYEEKNARVLFV